MIFKNNFFFSVIAIISESRKARAFPKYFLFAQILINLYMYMVHIDRRRETGGKKEERDISNKMHNVYGGNLSIFARGITKGGI